VHIDMLENIPLITNITTRQIKQYVKHDFKTTVRVNIMYPTNDVQSDFTNACRTTIGVRMKNRVTRRIKHTVHG